ncbi:pyrroloquinoline quinone biosynthesis protein PqqB [Flavisphingomonas formosensis]|uniref:pyrroloquinoline quinone biosynthesis protein PqqB n=1 Tax=Flavisphingomonas formosensis TaxID=861534 RepID=UPI0012F940AF|nr:pyrroloquinoline quinone biosynthesis protein PqqB [Sphingomonas formosensis]
MRILVLGAAAGGGFPQWNCNCTACRRSRSGDPAAPARSQAGFAVSRDGARWHLVNASPDLREQIARTPQLHSQDGLRGSPIRSVVLTGGDIDVIAGLLNLRERQPLTIHATASVHAILDANPVFDVLARDVVMRPELRLDEPFLLEQGLSATLFAVPGKVPLYMESGEEMQPIVVDGTTVGLLLEDGASRAFIIPGCAAMTPDLAERLRGADMVFFDGTLWHDDEMIEAGLGKKTGRRMGHMSLAGPEGTLAAFDSLEVKNKILIHMNNSNPVLLADSKERAAAEAAGWIVPEDGLEVVP